MMTFDCPFCDNPFEVDLPLGEDPVVTCVKCGRKSNLYRLFWVQKGIKLDAKKQIRCPFCNVLFAEGDYSDREQAFKCKNCKRLSYFTRIDGIPKEEEDDILQVKENQGP